MSITFAPTTPARQRPELNVSNNNGVALLQLLGLPAEEQWGEADPADFLGRVLLAQALLDVATDDEHGRPAVSEGNWIDCGRRPGYLAEKLALLHEIATWAEAHQVLVTWG